ncbi:MAG: exodeoxyribonuclease VII large subunit [Bacteroidales bacterium]|nr:exodeoxyribonuclease VII large subunit [Bacteroidales bacterium]
MPETIQNKQIFSLLEVTRSIQKTLEQRYSTGFWVKAEMIKLNHYSHSGHCYPDLVEKQQGKVIAQIRSNLWKRDFQRINDNFLQVLKEPLKDGIKILFLAKISFDPVYGISLHILDIDPSFTLGDLEKEKQETISRLQREGLFNKNKKTPFALLPQRLAIISVETSKGYADFLKVIDHNPWGYQFFHMLFPSILQGEKAVEGIIFQLSRIKKILRHFDLVAIIRGGGGDVGLSCYNNFELSKAIADFPLPVITGIGHATNETVTEMVGYENAITPTKLAEFLIQHFHNFAEPLRESQRIIADLALNNINDEKQNLRSEVKMFRSATKNIISVNRQNITTNGRSLYQGSAFLFRNQRNILGHIKEQTGRQATFLLRNRRDLVHRAQLNLSGKTVSKIKNEKLLIDGLEKNIRLMDPKNVLKRGFSITLKNGKAISTANEIEEGDQIDTLLMDGKLTSIVNSKKQS